MTPRATSRTSNTVSRPTACDQKSQWTLTAEVMALGTTEPLVLAYLSAPVPRSLGYGASRTTDYRTIIKINSTAPSNGLFRRRTQLPPRMAMGSTPRAIHHPYSGLSPPTLDTVTDLTTEMSTLTIPTSIRSIDATGSQRGSRAPDWFVVLIPSRYPRMRPPRVPRSLIPPSLPTPIHSSHLPKSWPIPFSIPSLPLLLNPSPRCRLLHDGR
jgi:hypothetical protein